MSESSSNTPEIPGPPPRPPNIDYSVDHGFGAPVHQFSGFHGTQYGGYTYQGNTTMYNPVSNQSYGTPYHFTPNPLQSANAMGYHLQAYAQVPQQYPPYQKIYHDLDAPDAPRTYVNSQSMYNSYPNYSYGRRTDFGPSSGYRGRGRGDRGRYTQRYSSPKDKEKEKEKAMLALLSMDIPEHIRQKVQQIGDSPEQVQSYIEARKKNFPSKENIKKKETELQDKRHRGELPIPEPEKLGSASKGKRNLGLGADESPDSKKSRHELEIPEIPDDICQYYLRGSCRFGSSCKSKHDPFARAKYVKVVSQQPRRIGSLKLPKPAESLLKKLLEKEIHTEQSIVLQSFRFFVQNNFFSPSTTEDKINL